MVVNRWLLATGLILTSITTVVVPALAEEEEHSVTASVEVAEVIDFTVSDAEPTGISFGSVLPGATAVPEVSQTASTPAVTLTVGGATTVDCDMEMRGAGDFSAGPGLTIPLGNAKWNASNDSLGAASITTSYAHVSNSIAGQPYSAPVWHWMDIPAGQATGQYETTFYYRAIGK